MQHTTNYDLPQWEDTDVVTREDVNGAMTAIDTAVKAAATAAGAAGKGNVQMDVFSYYGAGTYGSANKTQISFPEPPALFVILGINSLAVGRHGGDVLVFLYDSSYAASMYRVGISWNGSTASFYSSTRPEIQMNARGTYYVYALHVPET